MRSCAGRASTPPTSWSGAGPATPGPCGSWPPSPTRPVAAPSRWSWSGPGGASSAWRPSWPSTAWPSRSRESVRALGEAAGRERRGQPAAAVIDACLAEIEPLLGTRRACAAVGWTPATTGAVARGAGHRGAPTLPGPHVRVRRVGPQWPGPVVRILSPRLDARAQAPETDRYLRILVPPDADRRPIPAGAYNVAAQLVAVRGRYRPHPPSAPVPSVGRRLADGARGANRRSGATR